MEREDYAIKKGCWVLLQQADIVHDGKYEIKRACNGEWCFRSAPVT